MAGMWDNVQAQDGRYEVADGVSLLQHARSKPTCFNWEIFECGRRGQAPNATHRNAEECPHGKELVEGLDEASSQLNCRAKEEICHKWPLPTKAIRQDAEEDLQ
jgi:hypothetical protein